MAQVQYIDSLMQICSPIIHRLAISSLLYCCHVSTFYFFLEKAILCFAQFLKSLQILIALPKSNALIDSKSNALIDSNYSSAMCF